jgi:hypothetical protein
VLETLVTDDDVAALTGSLVVEVEADEDIDQSSHALPFSDGQAKLVGRYAYEGVLEPSAVVDEVVMASTGSLLVVEVTVDETDRVQSNQALPFSDGHAKLVG